MVLPDAQDAAFAGVVLPDSRFRVINSGEDWIFRLDDAHKAILIFGNAIGAALFLFLFIQSYHAGPKAEPNQLMTSANPQDGRSDRLNEISKVRKNFRVIVIKIA